MKFFVKMGSQRPGKFVRGFSMVDPEMVSKLHTDIKARGKEKYEIAQFNFTLPDFSQLDKEFVAYIMKDLIENSTLKALEESGTYIHVFPPPPLKCCLWLLLTVGVDFSMARWSNGQV